MIVCLNAWHCIIPMSQWPMQLLVSDPSFDPIVGLSVHDGAVIAHPFHTNGFPPWPAGIHIAQFRVMATEAEPRC